MDEKPPKKIYLQFGEDGVKPDDPEIDWNEVTWSITRIWDSDVEYILARAEGREVRP